MLMKKLIHFFTKFQLCLFSHMLKIPSAMDLMPGENKGFVKIDLKLEKDYISCTIEDNGIGREAAQEKKMKSEKNHNSLGTQIVSSRLDLVNALYGTSLKTIYTDLKNENGEPEGTRVEIHIPILS